MLPPCLGDSLIKFNLRYQSQKCLAMSWAFFEIKLLAMSWTLTPNRYSGVPNRYSEIPYALLKDS